MVCLNDEKLLSKDPDALDIQSRFHMFGGALTKREKLRKLYVFFEVGIRVGRFKKFRVHEIFVKTETTRVNQFL